MSPASRFALLGVSAFAALAPLSVRAQEAAAPPAEAEPAEDVYPDDEAYEVEELVVSASRQQRGAVLGDIPPELQLTPRDIRAYGVSNVSELIDALAPQTSSGRGGGRPVILVNGQRISSFVEVRDIPTEAIVRVDILPEEVSLKYGYRADQRVINMVLRPRFRAITLEADGKTPTQGEGASGELEANLFRVLRDSRLLLDAEISRSNRVLESDRDLADPSSNGAFRTLVPEAEGLELTAVYARPIREGLSGSLNGSLEATRSDSLLGLPTDDGGLALADPEALKRRSETVALHAGGGMNGAFKGWSWSLAGNADRNNSLTVTDREVAGTAFTDKSRAISTTADVSLVANGVLTDLPAGPLSTTLKVGASTAHFDSRALRAGVTTTGELSRDIGNFQTNLDFPIARRSQGVLAGLGDLSGNLNVSADQLSDFGTLTSLGYGLNWSPIEPLRMLVSVTEEENAPSVQQLGAPTVVTPGVRVFDFLRGETVEVTRIEGGAPGLDADHRSVMKVGLNLKPFDKTELTFSADYVRTRITDVISSFPTATSQIEAAFPDRFVRDADGRLIQVDSRPVNFDRRDTDQLRWGFTYRKPLGPTRPPGGRGAQDGQPGRRPEADRRQEPGPGGPPQGAARSPGGGFGPSGRGFGGRRFGGGPPGAGNLQIGLYHTLKLQDEITIRPGVPKLDLLDGAALGNAGGEPRHQLDLQTNLSKNGYGLALNARWRSGSEVIGGTFGDLKFEDLTTVNVRLFADLGMQPWARRDYPWLRGTRVSLSIDNLFDSRQEVRTADGGTPVNFQPDYLDPLGRQVRLSVRKLFF
ncbi:MAG TPA: TonB-dependent receptor [Phenylobacterium sp.]|nr:TonB-dependent receptor [Phenylobacterium sp.]